MLTTSPPAAYLTTSTYVTGYLQNSSTGINHDIVIDGKVAVWVVKNTANGTVASTSGRSVCGPSFLLHVLEGAKADSAPPS